MWFRIQIIRSDPDPEGFPWRRSVRSGSISLKIILKIQMWMLTLICFSASSNRTSPQGSAFFSMIFLDLYTTWSNPAHQNGLKPSLNIAKNIIPPALPSVFRIRISFHADPDQGCGSAFIFADPDLCNADPDQGCGLHSFLRIRIFSMRIRIQPNKIFNKLLYEMPK